jgi:N-acetyltransferase
VTATRPPHSTLQGRFLRLDPLTPEHLPALYEAIGHTEVFEFGFGGGLSTPPTTEEAFTAWALDHLEWDSGNPYAVILTGGPHDGAVAGTTTLGEFDLRREEAHLGWTAYDPRVWSTVVNPEAKLLLLGLAFDSGFGRVKIQTDALNQRSRAAIAKLGATFEGIVRRDKPRENGTWRDTALFSILAEEWPGVRARLERRIEQNTGHPVLYRTPAA